MIRLNERWAVGVIDNPPQWALYQLRMDDGKERWRAVSFCQTKKALLRAIDEKVVRGADFYPHSENLAVAGVEMAKLAAFPDKCDGVLLTREERDNEEGRPHVN